MEEPGIDCPFMAVEEMLAMARKGGHIKGAWQGRTGRFVIRHEDGIDFVYPKDVATYLTRLIERKRHVVRVE